MSLQYLDLDRSDFYQIHTYMQYYGSSLLFGGLIYPLSSDHILEKAYSESLFDNAHNSQRFIVDGIELHQSDLENMTIKQIIDSENQFLKRLQDLINESLIKAS